jgi:hypothetical protein
VIEERDTSHSCLSEECWDWLDVDESDGSRNLILEVSSKKWTPSTYNQRSGGVRWNGSHDRSIRRSSGSKRCSSCSHRS